MPFTLHIDADENRMFVRFVDHLPVEEVLGMLQQQLAHPSFRPGVHVLCDVTASRPTIDYPGLVRVFEFARDHVVDYAGSRWAIVAPEMLQYGLARALGMLVSVLPLEYQAFREADRALVWLGIPLASTPDASSLTPDR